MSTPAPQTKGSGKVRTIAIVVVIIIIAAVIGGYFVLYPAKSVSNAKINIASGTGTNPSLNFNPSSVTVVIGTNNTIVFTNNDITYHTVTFTSAPSGLSLGTISDSNLVARATFTVTLSTAGTYQYKCSIHPWMSGTIVVVGSSGAGY